VNIALRIGLLVFYDNMQRTQVKFFLFVAILPLHALAVRELLVQENRKRLTTKVEVLFVRHGHACHNALSYHTEQVGPIKTGKFKHLSYADAPLTDCGLVNSQANGHELRAALGNWTPQFVGTSSMIRAMETAMAMFPGYTVVPLPFIREDAMGACNSPKDLELQKAQLPADAIDWQHMETDIQLRDDRVKAFNHKKEYSAKEAREKVKYREFRAFLGEKIVPGLLPSELGPNRVVRLAIVTHSLLLKAKLKKYFQCDVKFANNEARLVTYLYHVNSQLLVELTSDSPSKNCKDPLGRPPTRKWGKERKYACSQDYRRCVSIDAKAMGLADGRPGDQSPWIKAPANGEECCLREDL